MIEVREYLDQDGRSPFQTWFASLNGPAAIKIAVVLERVAQGHTSSMKTVGEGVFEYKVDFGPGYRVYFGRDGNRLVILLGGGTKKRQQKDIDDAQAVWATYKQRKTKGA